MHIFDWMNNADYLAQEGHFATAYAIIVTAMLISLIRVWTWKFTLVILAAGMGAATVKEFWFDMVYEIPKQTWGDSILDWCFYAAGASVGMLVAWILVENLVRKTPIIEA